MSNFLRFRHENFSVKIWHEIWLIIFSLAIWHTIWFKCIIFDTRFNIKTRLKFDTSFDTNTFCLKFDSIFDIQTVYLNFDTRLDTNLFCLKFDTRFYTNAFWHEIWHENFSLKIWHEMCWKSANEVKQPKKACRSKNNHNNIFGSWQRCSWQK